jgi:Na+/phosphate symporter
MARERNTLGLGAVLPGSVRWALAGYALPAILIGASLFLIRNGPATAHSYNYALGVGLVFLLSASIAVACLAIAVAMAIQSLRHEPGSVKWPHYAVLLAAIVPTAFAALWLAQS